MKIRQLKKNLTRAIERDTAVPISVRRREKRGAWREAYEIRVRFGLAWIRPVLPEHGRVAIPLYRTDIGTALRSPGQTYAALYW